MNSRNKGEKSAAGNDDNQQEKKTTDKWDNKNLPRTRETFNCELV